MKFFKYFEYAYIGFAVFFIYEAITAWSKNQNQSYLYLFLAAVAVFMYFFKRKFRKKYQDKSN